MEPKATVVSILPREITDRKPNLYPGDFVIPAGNSVKPGLLIVTKSVFYIPMAFGAPSLQAVSAPHEVATSIVNDYVGALIGITDDCRPGLFVVNDGLSNPNEVVKQFGNEITKLRDAQNRWFMRLVTMADAEYDKHKQAESISDLQKMAARELNLKNKPWLLDINQLQINNCPACYLPVNTNAIICPTCKYILNMDKYNPKAFAVELRNDPKPLGT
jgi:hypothetical protein